MCIVTIPYSRDKTIKAELVEPFTDGSAVVRITVVSGKRKLRAETDEYFVDRLPSDWGLAFVLTKRELPTDGTDEIYRVLIVDQQDHICECLGHNRFGYCKHCFSLLGLLAAGEIPVGAA